MSSYFCHPGCCPWKNHFQCSACPVWLYKVLNWRTPTLGSTVFQGFCTTYTKCHNCTDVFSAAEQRQQMPLLRKPCTQPLSVKASLRPRQFETSVMRTALKQMVCWLCRSFLHWPEKINAREKRGAAAAVTSRNLFKSRCLSRVKLTNSSSRFYFCFVADELWVSQNTLASRRCMMSQRADLITTCQASALLSQVTLLLFPSKTPIW